MLCGQRGGTLGKVCHKVRRESRERGEDRMVVGRTVVCLCYELSTDCGLLPLLPRSPRIMPRIMKTSYESNVFVLWQGIVVLVLCTLVYRLVI